jgi:mycoredoxin-dependent peroxiredoxin
MAIAVGQEAPDFQLRAHDGSSVKLSEQRGKNVVLVFYSFTFSGVCQGEVCELRDNLADFEAADAQVFGISCDTVPAQKMWVEQQGLNFPLLSDFWPHGEVAKRYGVFNEALGAAMRGTFVIDKNGVIQAVIESPDLPTPRGRKQYKAALAKLG